MTKLRRVLRRISTVTLGAVLLALSVTAVAFAGGSLDHSTTGAEFDGNWEWYSSSEANGGFHHWGWLYDWGCSDGDNVYTKVKVEGYTPNSYYGNNCEAAPSGNSEWQNIETYDPQQLYTTYAEFSVCRDRNFPLSDNCSAKDTFSR